MKALLVISISFCACIALGQSSKVDSLELLSNQLVGTKQIDVLNKLSFELMSYNNRKANSLAKRALSLSESINYSKGKAEALLYIGITESSFGNTIASKQLLKISINLSKSLDLSALQGYGLTILGSFHAQLYQTDSAKMAYDEAFELLRANPESYELSYLYLNLAEYYRLKSETDLELDYLKKCWAIREKLAEKKFLIWIGDLLASYYVETGNFTEAHTYLQKAQDQLGRDTVSNSEISFIYRQRAVIYINQGQFLKAFDLLTKAKRYFEQAQDQFELMLTQSEIGYVFMDMANYELSIENYFAALTIAEKFHYESERTKLLFRIAWVYYQLRQDKFAKDYITKCLELARKNAQKREEGSALNLLGLLADRQNANDKALNYYTQALTIRQDINEQNGIASTLLNIGVLLEKQGQLQQALDYQLKSLAIEETSGHSVGIAYSYQSLGQLNIRLKNFKQAATYLTRAEALARKLKSGNILIDVFRNRRDLLLAQQKYREASEYGLHYDALKDSIFSLNLTDRVSNLQNIFQLEQKENAITILNQQQELQSRKIQIQEAKLSQQRGIILIGSIGAVILLVIAYIIYRYYSHVKGLNKQLHERSEEIQAQADALTKANDFLSKLNIETQEQKEEIQAQAEELTESNNIISGINATLEERIEQRTSELKQAYKELDTFFYRSSHDFRRPLTTFMGLAEVAKITLRDQSALDLFEKVNETARNLDKMLMKLQSISDLGVQELVQKEIFFEEFLKHECGFFDQDLLRKNIRVEVNIAKNLSFYSYPALVKIILNNLIENAISFCKSQDAFIRFTANPKGNNVLIEIEDNGYGIPPEYLNRVFEMYFRAHESSKGNGLGLYIAKKAVDKLKGTISIQSEVGNGTTVSILFPHQMDEFIK
jgi:signal transduction histidine kinase